MRTKNQSIFNAKHLLPLISGIIATIIILTFTLSHPYNRALDDAYITYRYAENFRNGMGLVYNAGEYVLGTTTPFFALLLGTLSFITNDIEFLGYWISALSWITIAWLSIFIIPKKLPAARITAPLLIATQAQMLPVLGMETALLTALMFAVAWAWLHNHIRLTILFAAMLLLTRQDSALWLLILGLESWRRTRRFPWREGVAATIATAPWFIYALARYGSPLPNSAAAKIGQANLMPVSGQVPFFEQFWHINTASFPTIGIVLLVFLWLYFVFQQINGEPQFLWLLAWLILYLSTYTALNVVNFNWYFIPPIIVLNLISALSIGYLGRDAAALFKMSVQKQHLKKHILPAAGLIAFALLLSTQWQQAVNLLQRRTFHETYYQVGEWLYHNSPPDSSVAAIEIGIIGYYSQRPILDTMGLVSADMNNHQLGWTETLTYALNSQQPDYAVVLAETAWDALLPQWWFRENYLPVSSFGRATIYKKQVTSDRYETVTDVMYESDLLLAKVLFNNDQIIPGEFLDIWLNLTVLAKQNAGYQITTFLANSETSEWTAVTHTNPFGHTYDSKKWQIGDHLSIPIRMPVPDDLAVGAYQLGVVVYDPVQSAGLAVQDMPEKRDVRVGWLRYGSPPETAVSPPHQINAQWQNGLSIQSTSLAQSAISGEQVSLQLALKTTRPVERDLTLFVHLIDAQGSIIAQNDQRPFRGRWPTTVWRRGETWIDTFNLQLPDDTPAGSYALRIGWYDDQGQLPLLNSPDTFIILPDMISVNTVTGAAHADNGF